MFFEWYDTCKQYVNLSAAGPPIFQADSIQSVLRSFIVDFDTYEAQRAFDERMTRATPSEGSTLLRVFQSRFIYTNSLVWTDAPRRSEYSDLYCSFWEHISNLLNHDSSSYASQQWEFLNAAIIGSMIHRLTGRHREAVAVLEALISLSQPDFNNIGWEEVYYTRALIELALCYLKDGYDGEASHLLSRAMGLPAELDVVDVVATNCRKCTGPAIRKVFEGVGTLISVVFSPEYGYQSSPMFANSRELEVEVHMWPGVRQLVTQLRQRRENEISGECLHLRTEIRRTIKWLTWGWPAGKETPGTTTPGWGPCLTDRIQPDEI